MQEMGEGIRRISALMNGHQLAPPEVDSVDHSFLMTFSRGISSVLRNKGGSTHSRNSISVARKS